MNRRALMFSLLMAVMSLALVLLYMRQFEQEMSGGERVTLLVANRALERGVLIADDMLTTRDVPLAYVENRAIRVAERHKVVGVPIANTVQAQDLILWSDLAVATDERDLSALVQPGSRAVTVRASNPDEVKGNALIRPGDYVDVLATLSDNATGRAGGSESRSAIVLLQKILVLAVGLETEAQMAGASGATQATVHPSQRDMVLTLSLNLQEAQLLALASEKGRLSVAVRNPFDQRIVEQLPDMNASALFDTKTRVAIQNARKGGPIRLVDSNGAGR